VCWCARCRRRRRTGLSDDGVVSSSMLVVDLPFFSSSHLFYDDYSYSYHQNNDIILLITTIILNLSFNFSNEELNITEKNYYTFDFIIIKKEPSLFSSHFYAIISLVILIRYASVIFVLYCHHLFFSFPRAQRQGYIHYVPVNE
jgi:hypothetical protein